MGNELKPCPFCGGEATISKRAAGYVVDCLNPCISQKEIGVGWFRSEQEAIGAWNTRHPSRNDVLEEAARPFVEYFNARRDFYIRRHGENGHIGAANFDKMPDDWPMENATFTMGDFRKLARALKDRDG